MLIGTFILMMSKRYNLSHESGLSYALSHLYARFPIMSDISEIIFAVEGIKLKLS